MFIYCDNALDHKTIDPDYAYEKRIAQDLGFDTHVFSYELLTEGAPTRATRFIPNADALQTAVYRGWMLRPSQYASLYDALLRKNIQLINTPQQYQHCHYLPKSYDLIKSYTPQSSWCTSLDSNSINDLLDTFETGPLIVKDFVKSEKHNWDEACYIPSASDKSHAMKIISRFLELRGSYLNEGIVLRRFEELTYLATHSKSGMPLTKEYRLFFYFNELAAVLNYWNEGDYGTQQPELDIFRGVGRTIQSNFFTMDIAQKVDGSWMIMELGDGQVAGLPETMDVRELYQKFNV